MIQRIPAEQGAIVRKVFYGGRQFGVSGTRGVSPRRVHAGSDASAWSKPKMVVYGDVVDKAAVVALAAGWTGEIEFQR